MEQFSKGLLKSFSNAFKKLYTNKGYKPEDLAKEPEFKKAIESTYEVLNFGIKDNVVDGTLLRKLQQDTFLFSAFKTHAELTEAASRLLLNADKKIRPWFDFKQEVLKLHQTYNVNYLEAEYEFAKQSSIMADKWQREVIERSRNADDNYWLQYRTAGDERVRESHAALHDTTLPKSDPFWSHYYPPNGWRCRCTTVSVRPEKYPMSDSTEAFKKGEAATTQIGKDGKNKLEIFRFNPGKEQVVFPKNNAYSKVVGAGVIKPGISSMFSDNEKALRKAKDIEIRDWAVKNIKEQGLKLTLDNFKTKEVLISRGAIKSIGDHLTDVNLKEVAKEVINLMPKMKYIETAPLNPDAKNYERKLRKGITNFHYYKFTWNDKKFRLNTEEINGKFEKPYAVNLLK